MNEVADALGDLDTASRRKALSGNAARLYNIPVD
jgi:hypothetical protein